MRKALRLSGVLPLCLAMTAVAADGPKVAERVERRGDEIVVCGQLYHTTTPVVLWMDPGGYDAYRVERRFAPVEEVAKTKDDAGRARARYGLRRAGLTPELLGRIREDGWDVPTLASVVDQFVIHFDACGTSRKCFEVLQDERGLSVHFMLDLDGTIYQTLDLKESAWHATIANGRSVGIEIANIGTFSPDAPGRAGRWYRRDAEGRARIEVPGGYTSKRLGEGWVPRPVRDEPVVGTVQGQRLGQYDLTPEQYAALIRLTATLCTVFPKIACDYPRDASGVLIPQKLDPEDYRRYHGILGHYHVQANKVDPGPAFQWDRLIEGARTLMRP